jgi:hypothetical protein
MFTKTAPVAEPTPVEVGTAVPTELIPLSYVALDHPEPGGGWDAYLTVRNIPVLTDDLGRASISRADAKQLFIERRENEAVRVRWRQRRNEGRLSRIVCGGRRFGRVSRQTRSL